ncbi:MAG: PAS domain S-box protein, partial [Candidatus Lokiarchaeota archaeon]|nr:PAS domain S-box protein [Candidatus Lokiarchaeota archaeon]
MASSSELGYNIGEILTENLDDLIFVLNENFECEFVNEKIHIAKLGYLSLRDKITVILHQDDIQIGNIFLRRLLKNGQAIEHLRVRQKNSYVYHEFKGKTFTNDKHEIKLLITSRDISQFKRSEREWLKKEEELKRLAENMKEIRFWKLLQTTDEKTSFQKFKELVENIREAYFEVELNGNFVFMNTSFTKLTGYSYDELVGKNYQLLMDDENKNKVFNIFNSVYKSGLPQVSSQFEFIKKGDKRVIVETSVYLSRNPSGRKLGFYGITRDITQRFKLEQKLKQSEEKYRHLFENSPFGIWIVDLNGVVIDCNAPKNIMLSKVTRDDIIGKNFIEVLGIFDRPEYFIPFFKSKFKHFVEGTPMKALEFKMTPTDGIEKWINVRGLKIKLGEDTFIQVLMQDITEKKIADLKLQKSEEELKILNKELERKVLERTKELRESEEKFRTIAENSLMGVAIIQDNKVKYINQQFAILSGYDVDEVKVFGPMDIFQSIYPDDRKLVMEQLRKKQKGSKDYISHYHYRIFDKEGGIKWVDNYSKTINFMGRP